MVQSIKTVLNKYGISGDILLYRGEEHRKKRLAEFLALNCGIGDGDVCTWSDGAFSLYLARALPNKTVHACFDIISPDYGELMEAQSNLVLHPKIHRKSITENGYAYFVSTHPELVNINQYSDAIVKKYYENYFFNIVSAVRGYNVDAFCDCPHSGATLAGCIDSNLVDWKFIAGHLDVNEALYNGYTTSIQSFLQNKDIISESCNYFDTYELGLEIEKNYPDFGNVYEATRSISAAMRWLQKNPGKTVVVYVGDAFEREGTKFNNTSKSFVGAKELYLLTKAVTELREKGTICKSTLSDYAGLWNVDDGHKKYLLSKMLTYACKFVASHGVLNRAKALQLLHFVGVVNPNIGDSTLGLLKTIWTECDEELKESLKPALLNDVSLGGDEIIQYEVMVRLKTLIDFDKELNDLFAVCEEKAKELYSYFKMLGPVR